MIYIYIYIYMPPYGSSIPILRMIYSSIRSSVYISAGQGYGGIYTILQP